MTIPLLSLLLGISLAAEPEKSQLLLVAGTQKVIKVNYEVCSAMEECIRIGNKGLAIIQYAPGMHEIIISPMGRGETNLLIRDERGDLRDDMQLLVVEYNLPRFEQELRKLLEKINGVEVRIEGMRLLVDGKVSSYQDFNRVVAAVGANPYVDVTTNLVRMNEAAYLSLAKQIEKEIGLPTVKVRTVNEGFVLEGTVANKTELSRAKEKAAFMLHKVILLEPKPRDASGEAKTMRVPGMSPLNVDLKISP